MGIWIGGVAFIVLLVACANVANLLMTRAVRRRREIAVRRAIGGTPARLLQQVLTESLVLSIIGSAAGVLGAWAVATALPRVFPAAEAVDGVLTDVRTLAFAAALALLTAVLAGLFPALQSRGSDLAGSLKAGYREAGYRRPRTSTGLLLAQTAMCVVLLVGAGLFVRSVDELRSVRLGYIATFGPPGIEMFVRVEGDPRVIAGPLHSMLQRQMPGTAYMNIVPFEDVIEPAMQPWTSGARMFLTFGGLALLLAAIGLYAVIAFAVAHRTQEIGIRIAMGARMRNVLGLILEDELRVSLAGVLTGTAVALGASNWIGGLRFGVSPR